MPEKYAMKHKPTITDLTFFTNEPGAIILDRFRKTQKDGQFFDVLVGYFRTCIFSHLYESFEVIDKIRILADWKKLPIPDVPMDK